ncbi:hypothetical protein [Thermococcus sp.]|uniref:hypothetical protein n=1 Tax=Thermococcus sp. TaxID=35749 RepID=UPI0025D78D56|nr:hypothetical protein [Thermococcus sp.]
MTETITTALITAGITALATVSANKALLQRISKQLDELEEKIFQHEQRLSRLEGRLEKVRA